MQVHKVRDGYYRITARNGKADINKRYEGCWKVYYGDGPADSNAYPTLAKARQAAAKRIA